jgi:pSer/pThr/pTyr-binding forkhead associated (FHA) protein
MTQTDFFRLGYDGPKIVIDPSLPAFVIGSDARSHLHLFGEAVAPSHAVISRRGSALVIAPCFMHLDLFVNNRRVMLPLELHPGDAVQIGSNTLIFGQEALAVSSALALPAPLKPAVIPRSTHPMRVASQAAPASSLALSQPSFLAQTVPAEIYFPKPTAQASGGLFSLMIGLLTILGIFSFLGYGLFGGSVSASAQPAINPYAYNDGNVTIIMFDADW